MKTKDILNYRKCRVCKHWKNKHTDFYMNVDLVRRECKACACCLKRQRKRKKYNEPPDPEDIIIEATPEEQENEYASLASKQKDNIQNTHHIIKDNFKELERIEDMLSKVRETLMRAEAKTCAIQNQVVEKKQEEESVDCVEEEEEEQEVEQEEESTDCVEESVDREEEEEQEDIKPPDDLIENLKKVLNFHKLVVQYENNNSKAVFDKLENDFLPVKETVQSTHNLDLNPLYNDLLERIKSTMKI